MAGTKVDVENTVEVRFSVTDESGTSHSRIRGFWGLSMYISWLVLLIQVLPGNSRH